MMRILPSRCLTALALSLAPLAAQAATTVSVTTVPEGVMTYSLPTTHTTPVVSYLSFPLSDDPAYTGVVSTLTTSVIGVSDTPWTNGAFATAAAPYFVKFLTGLEAGRTVKVTANTDHTLTLDVKDNTSQTVALNASKFAVAKGDSFELFAGDTLASIFGLGTNVSPLLLKGGTSITAADTVSIYNTTTAAWQLYYFNTTSASWKLSGASANYNNTVVYPYSAVQITRLAHQAATSFAVTGRVPEVARLTKAKGGGTLIYDSTGYPVDLKLSQLKFGPNWVESTSSSKANTVALWNTSTLKWDTYFQLTDSTWRKTGDASTNQSSVVIPAGTGVQILQRKTVSGLSSFLTSVLPYSLN